MKTRQITLPGRGNIRIRVITWNEGEAAQIHLTQTPVPDLHYWDDQQAKLFRRYRIKQVLQDGTESPWVSQRRLTIRPGFDQNVHVRIRPVSATKQYGQWQYVSVRTGSKPGDPGTELFEAFVRDFLEALGDDFIDSVQLNIHREDAAAVSPIDAGRRYDFAAHYTEPALLEGLSESIEVVRDLLKEYLVEHVAIQLSIPYHIMKTYRAQLDRAALRAVDEYFEALLETALHDVGELLVKENVSVVFDDGSHGAVRSFVDTSLWRDMQAAWVHYLREDQVVRPCLDAIKFDLRQWWTEEVQFKFAERVSWLRLMKEIFAEDTLELKLSVGRIWEVRYQLFDQIALRMIDSSNLFLQMDIDELLYLDFAPSVQVVTDRNEAYVHDRLDRKRMIDQITQAIALTRSDTALFSPTDSAEWAFVRMYLEVLEGLNISEEVAVKLLAAAALEFTERLEIPLHVYLTRLITFANHDTCPPIPILSQVTDLSFEFAERANFVPRERFISYELGERYGASLEAFIMGRFIMGVTPMGRR